VIEKQDFSSTKLGPQH